MAYLIGLLSVMQQIPGTLTGLGILGTFLGLLIGLRSLGFSSATSTIERMPFVRMKSRRRKPSFP